MAHDWKHQVETHRRRDRRLPNGKHEYTEIEMSPEEQTELASEVATIQAREAILNLDLEDVDKMQLPQMRVIVKDLAWIIQDGLRRRV